MSKMMVKRDGLWTPMANLKGDTGPLPADNSVTNDALVTDGAKTNTAYLMGNRLTATAEGEMVSVDDSYPSAALSLTVDGKSTQVTTTGKNLLSDQTGDWVRATYRGNDRWWTFIPIEEGGTYFYSRATSTNLLAGYANGTDFTDYEALVTLTNYNSGYKFTNTNNYQYIVISCYASTYTPTSFVTLFPTNKVQLEKGSAKTDYERYSGGAASPRPDWPQDIISRTKLTIKTCAKNFVPSDDPENPNANYTFNSSNRVVWDSEMEGFRLTDSGSGVAYTVHTLRNPRAIFVAPRDGVYTFGADTKYYTSGTDFGFRAELNGAVINGYGWGSPKQSSDTEWTRHSITRTLSKGDRFGATIYQTVLWRNISVVAGSEDIYEPYSGGASSLLPEGTSLRSLPDGTKDELYLTYLRPSSRDGWAWYEPTLIQRVGLLNLDGSESYGSEGGRYYLQVDDMKRLANYAESMLCDYLKVYSKQGDIGGVVNFVSGISGYARAETYYPGKNWIYIAIEKGMTAADTKQWVSEHPMLVTYLLATPITTQLDPVELPIMQAGTTNIWTDPSTSLSVTYERDRNIVISKLEAAAADLATS